MTSQRVAMRPTTLRSASVTHGSSNWRSGAVEFDIAKVPQPRPVPGGVDQIMN